MNDGGMNGMPIPMPPGHADDPGLVGLAPDVGDRSFPAPASIRDACRGEAESHRGALATGDTLDLTATLVRRTITGTTFVDVRLQRPGARSADSRAAERDDHRALSQPHRSAEHRALARRAARQSLRRRARHDAGGGAAGRRVHSIACISPTPASTGITRTCARTSSRRWACSATCSSTRPSSDYYSPVNQRAAARARRPARERRYADSVRQGSARLRADGARRERAARERRTATIRSRHTTATVVRFYLTNVASSRTYNLSFGGAPIKVVASDQSRFEREELVPSVVLAPAERYVVEVKFDKPGRYALVNASTGDQPLSGRVRARSRHARHRHRRRGAGQADLRDASSRRCAPTRRVARRSTRYRKYFDRRAGQAADAHRRDERAAAGDRAVHERRHGVLRAGRVGRRHAGHELALDGEAGAVDPARRRDGEGEHGHRLARQAAGRW